MAPLQLDPHKILDTTRYNGGWIKYIDRIDKTKNNGYSLVGAFKRSTGLDNYHPGKLYLDCGIGGSRNHPSESYTLFRVEADGTCTILQKIENGGQDWAMQLWPTIEANLPAAAPAAPVTNPLEKFSTDELTAEILRRQNEKEQR